MQAGKQWCKPTILPGNFWKPFESDNNILVVWHKLQSFHPPKISAGCGPGGMYTFDSPLCPRLRISTENIFLSISTV